MTQSVRRLRDTSTTPVSSRMSHQTGFPGRLPPGHPAHAAAMPAPEALPPKYSVQEGRHGKTIRVGAWEIQSVKKAIMNVKEIDAAEKALSLPLPEMTFGNNALRLSHQSGVNITFDALSALGEVATGEGWEERVGGGVLVSMAEQWSKRSATTALSDVPLSTKPVRPHDWTFSTTYAGTCDGPCTFEGSSTHEIPMTLLARQDPVLDRILFYDDVGLFEDELHDNGASELNVRVRVMPHGYFLLLRLFVRVDRVLFRIYDVRIYHSFSSSEIVRDRSGLEADYDDVKAFLEKPSDLSPLADANFVYGALQKLAARGATHPPKEKEAPSVETGAAATRTTVETGSKPPLVRGSSRTRGKPWPGLGRKVDVLVLPGASLESAQQGLDKLSL